MKRSVLIFMFFISAYCVNAQSAGFTYSIKLKYINDPASAKEVTTYMRYFFGTYTAFNDASDTYEFNAAKNISEAAFLEWAGEKALTVLYFHQEPCKCIAEEE